MMFWFFLLFAVTYPRVSKLDGTLAYRLPQDAIPSNAILWDDSTAILWDDSTYILWD